MKKNTKNRLMLIKNFNKKLIRKIEIIKSEQKKKLVFAMITNYMHFFFLFK